MTLSKKQKESSTVLLGSNWFSERCFSSSIKSYWAFPPKYLLRDLTARNYSKHLKVVCENI